MTSKMSPERVVTYFLPFFDSKNHQKALIFHAMTHTIISGFSEALKDLTLYNSSMGDKDSDDSSTQEASPDAFLTVFRLKNAQKSHWN